MAAAPNAIRGRVGCSLAGGGQSDFSFCWNPGLPGPVPASRAPWPWGLVGSGCPAGCGRACTDPALEKGHSHFPRGSAALS